MKHKFYYSIPTACILMLILFTTSQAKAQQPTDSQPANVSQQIAKGDPTAIYTYKVFQAPNKMYGFDILKNSKFIFHQPNVPGIVALTVSNYRCYIYPRPTIQLFVFFFDYYDIIICNRQTRPGCSKRDCSVFRQNCIFETDG